MLMVTLGLIAQKNGDLPEAVRQYSSAFELQHSDVRACCWRKLCGLRTRG